MKKETKESIKFHLPLLLCFALLGASHWCEDTYWGGFLHGLACGMLILAFLRISTFLGAAFKAHPPYKKLKEQRNGNNQTL